MRPDHGLIIGCWWIRGKNKQTKKKTQHLLSCSFHFKKRAATFPTMHLKHKQSDVRSCNIMYRSPKLPASSRDKERGPQCGMNEAGEVRLVSLQYMRVLEKMTVFTSWSWGCGFDVYSSGTSLCCSLWQTSDCRVNADRSDTCASLNTSSLWGSYGYSPQGMVSSNVVPVNVWIRAWSCSAFWPHEWNSIQSAVLTLLTVSLSCSLLCFVRDWTALMMEDLSARFDFIWGCS